MSMRDVESRILVEAKDVTKNKKLRLKDIREWSTGSVKVEENEVAIFLPYIGVNISIFKEHDNRE